MEIDKKRRGRMDAVRGKFWFNAEMLSLNLWQYMELLTKASDLIYDSYYSISFLDAEVYEFCSRNEMG